MHTFVLSVLLAMASAVAQETTVETFLFQSNDASALTTDRTGANLPYSSGGWKSVGSMGDLSDKLRSSEAARLRSDGYLVPDKEEPRSTRVEDWRPFPPGSFHLTERALTGVRKAHEGLSLAMGGPSVVSFTWGPVSVKEKASPKWRELGPKLTVGGFLERNVPSAAVENVEGVPLLFLFDPKSLPSPTPTKIDYGPTGFVFVN